MQRGKEVRDTAPDPIRANRTIRLSLFRGLSFLRRRLFFGLSLKRLGSWLLLMQVEAGMRPPGEWDGEDGAALVALVVSMVGKAGGFGGVDRVTWRRRMRHCPKCPLYDRGLHRCRPFTGSEFGCGCFVPFLAMVPLPYPEGCWADAYLSGQLEGWGANEKCRGGGRLPRPVG